MEKIIAKSFLFFLFVVAETAMANNDWDKKDPFSQKVFIENKGQFNFFRQNEESKILYGVNDNGLSIYFTNKGLFYYYEEEVIPKDLAEEIAEEKNDKKEEVPGELERKLAEKIKIIPHTIHLEWICANANTAIIAEYPNSAYYTFGDEKKLYKANGYKKLVYKNLYDGIDVEYVFHPNSGIKYTLIVHPGADVAKIKMKYTGMEKLFINAGKNLKIKTPLGDITDHAPITFYQENNSGIIASSFHLDSNTVSFILQDYDHTKTIVVDPWTTVVTVATTNKALEIEKDVFGNIFILGGGDPGYGSNCLILQKYSSAGTLLWSYNTGPFLGIGRKGMYGDDLKIDKAGNVYFDTGSGFDFINGMSPSIWKISQAGTIIWSKQANVIEPYRIFFDCGETSLLYAGGYADQNSVIRLNPATGNLVSSQSFIFPGGADIDDLRDWVRAPNGNYYGMTINNANGPNGHLRAFSPAFTLLWSVNHGYLFPYWTPGYTGHVSTQPASLHLIAVNNNFIYTTSGAVVQKRNLSNGAVITTVTIPGGILASNTNGNSGIVLDTCGNVYVSSQTGVYKYDPNLVLLTSAGTPGAVYDICLGSNGEILACGNGFLSSLNMSACTPCPTPLIADNSVYKNPSCNLSNGSATVKANCGRKLFSYVWSNGSQTLNSNVVTNTITGLAAGTYSVIVSDADCLKDTAYFTLTNSGSLTLSSTQIDATCGSPGSAAVVPIGGTPNYTYLWSNGSTGNTISGLVQGTYSVTVNDAGGCTAAASVTIAGSLPLIAQFTKGTANCAGCGCKEWLMVTATGGTSPYSYNWPDGYVNRYKNHLCPGTYAIKVTDKNGCSVNVNLTAP